IAIRITVRSNALVNLYDLQGVPGNVFIREFAQHLPRGAATAYGKDEAFMGSRGFSSGLGNELRGLPGYGICIGEHLDIHALLQAFANVWWDSASRRAGGPIGQLPSAPRCRARIRRRAAATSK